MLKAGMYINDRYEIIDKVGSGGMADVYKAKCHRLNRLVAVKVLKQEFSDDKTFVQKFRGEARSAAGLSHPNIVNVYDVGEDNGLYFIVMELIEGITLKSFIERKGKLEIKEAIGIAIQIAMGLEAAHSNHIVHRDIKPQNIIISKEGKVKVTDFGIAKAANSNTITSNAMGSVHYLSPEQARGGYSDEKSDIYSLGVTLYEMLTGQVPFAGDNTVSIALLHIQGEAIPLREVDSTIPYSIERIVQKCMQKKPERRYLSVSELIQDLKRSISNPNGDFVVIPQAAVSDSPTITFSADEVNSINYQAGLKSTPTNTATNTGRNPLYDTGNHTTNIDTELRDTDVRRKTPLDNIDEEDELDSVDPRIEKLIIAGTIVAGIVLTVVIIVFVSRFFNLFQRDKKEPNDQGQVTLTPTPTDEPDDEDEVKNVIIPPLVGLTLEEAIAALKLVSENLEVTYDEGFSDEYEKNIVIGQTPEKGTEIPPDAAVSFVISAGVETIEIPNVYNYSESTAMDKIVEAGFEVAKETAFNTEIEKGRVIETVPARNEHAAKGSKVTIIVSDGPEDIEVFVPDLINLSQNEALNQLEDAGLARGSIKNDYSETIEAGKIKEQSIVAGTKVKKGTAIDIVVSLGSGVVATPTPTPTEAPNDEDGDDDDLYVGDITISDNPFTSAGDKGIVLIELEQDGRTKNLLKAEKKQSDFPISITDIYSESDSIGTVRMFVGREVSDFGDGVVSENGKLIKYEQYPTSWAIEFESVGN